MPLSDQQRARLARTAKEEGVDVNELIAEAEAVIAEKEAPAPTGVAPSSSKPPRPEPPTVAAPMTLEPEQPKLFQYHLPFVTVNEVRTIWLGLDEIEGGDENAAKYAARMSAPQAGATSPSLPGPGQETT